MGVIRVYPAQEPETSQGYWVAASPVSGARGCLSLVGVVQQRVPDMQKSPALRQSEQTDQREGLPESLKTDPGKKQKGQDGHKIFTWAPSIHANDRLQVSKYALLSATWSPTLGYLEPYFGLPRASGVPRSDHVKLDSALVDPPPPRMNSV